ncbi:MAG: hypothetical protein Ctma_0676 [Catillopecten margaritatus gill symbiont]|uniref:HTH cro/C1-type domain-containing protein n=1 Tax=Catillopecten margaritatus gill symbiont TaxID=3083288 RepID=A0AAU6PG18_9GAMM
MGLDKKKIDQLPEFNIADHINTADEAQEYLQEALREGLSSWLVSLGDIAKSVGMKELAERSGLHRENIYRVFKEGANPSVKTVDKLIKAMGIRLKMVV